MLKLYGALASPYVARVVLAARYKKLDLPVEMPGGGLKSPEYLAMNPYGKMPTLEHGGRHVIESQVICEYLEELYPAPSILPGDALARALARTVSRAVVTLPDIPGAKYIGSKECEQCHEEIYKNHMGIHLDIAMDAISNLKARWPDVERQLHSEW